MIPTPPKRLLLTQVPKYIRFQYGNDVTKQTVYNWAKVGRNTPSGERRLLKTVEGGKQGQHGGPCPKRYTTNVWVDQFLLEATEKFR